MSSVSTPLIGFSVGGPTLGPKMSEISLGFSDIGRWLTMTSQPNADKWRARTVQAMVRGQGSQAIRLGIAPRSQDGTSQKRNSAMTIGVRSGEPWGVRASTSRKSLYEIGFSEFVPAGHRDCRVQQPAQTPVVGESVCTFVNETTDPIPRVGAYHRVGPSRQNSRVVLHPDSHFMSLLFSTQFHVYASGTAP
ncbi:MAG: hypothetical protein GEV06_16695 [Luteitalea sp.]|nr:hypothetical protein [Luteitalea sp.]